MNAPNREHGVSYRCRIRHPPLTVVRLDTGRGGNVEFRAASRRNSMPRFRRSMHAATLRRGCAGFAASRGETGTTSVHPRAAVLPPRDRTEFPPNFPQFFPLTFLRLWARICRE
jgi:hypothetical protein